MQELYKRFFNFAPQGQDFFKQSSTRLNLDASRGLCMTLEVFLSGPRGGDDHRDVPGAPEDGAGD